MFARPSISIARSLVAVIALVTVYSCGTEDPLVTEDPTITLSLTPTAATVEQGESVEVTGAATVGGSFTGTASVTVEGVPTGITGTVGAPQTTGATTTVPVTLDVGASVAPGVYPVTVRAAGSGVSAEATFTLTVESAASFMLEIDPESLSIEQGTSAGAEIEVTRTAFEGAVSLSADGAPAGMTVSFDPADVTGDGSVVTVTVGGSVDAGTYDVTIEGEATGTEIENMSVDLAVTVTEPAGAAYSISVTPDEFVLDQAQPVNFVQAQAPARVNQGFASVMITRVNQHTADVELSLVEAPEGVTGVFTPNPVTGEESELVITVGPNVTPGEYTAFVRGDDGALDPRVTPIELVISAAPAFGLGIEPDGLTLEQGSEGTASITVERVNFDGGVTLTLTGAPDGVTGSFDNNPEMGEGSTLTISVGEMVEAGEYDLSVHGEASGLNGKTVALDLTVTVAAGFSLGFIEDMNLQQGGSESRTVTIEREGGFDASVTVSVTPEVSGLTIELDPTSTTGNSVSLTATASMSLAPQTYLFEISGNAEGEPESSVGLDINVTAAGGSDARLDFSTCSPTQKPLWLAYKDGDDAWMPVTGVSDVYEFDVSDSTVGVAIATASSLFSNEVAVNYMTQGELLENVFLPGCEGASDTKQVSFTATGLAAAESGALYLGGGQGFFAGNGSFNVGGVSFGTFDAVAMVQDLVTPGSERVFIRRDQNVTDLGTIDFALTNSEVVAAGMATITVAGLAMGENYSGAVAYNTSTVSSSCQPATLQTLFQSTSPTFTAYGVPGGTQQNGDFHSVSLFAFDEVENSRTVIEDFEALGNRTVDLPTAIPVPTITDVGGGTPPYKMLQATLAMPGEYNGFSGFTYRSNGKEMTVNGSQAFLGDGTQTLTAPDLSGITGWDGEWVPGATDMVEWTMLGTGGFGDRCTEGGRVVLSTRVGTEG